MEGLIFRRGLCTERNLRLKIDWAGHILGTKFYRFPLFYFVFEDNFQVQAPMGLHLEGRFNRRCFALRVWGAYIWRGLFSEFYGRFGILLGIQKKFIVANIEESLGLTPKT